MSKSFEVYILKFNFIETLSMQQNLWKMLKLI